MGLSDPDTNLFERALRYKSNLDYKANDVEQQDDEVQERTVKRLTQQQKILSAEEISKVIEAYKSGLTIYQLAERFDCHRTTISRHLLAQGVEMRNRPMTEAQIDEAVKLYKSGLSCVKVGKIVGVDGKTVLNRLRDRGVRVRGANEERDSTLL
ncbi:MAG: hypothetical protein PHO93_00325 [Candidatus Saccharimonadaceae bacterium]|nr:hypothetical protein [Candidatus Saccharimonadaceae bacterium]